MAYLDPGSTYIAIQGLLGLAAGFSATLIVYRRRIVDAFKRLCARRAADHDPTRTTIEVPGSEADMPRHEDAETKSALP